MKKSDKSEDISLNTDKASVNATSLLTKDLLESFEQYTKHGLDHEILELNSRDIDDNMMPEICEWIKKLGDRVRRLRMECNKITSQGANALFDTLKTSNSSLLILNLNYNVDIDDKCIKSLGEFINNNKSIEHIYMQETLISDSGIMALAPYIEDKSVPFLMKMIESSHLETLEISGTSINKTNRLIPHLASNILKYGSSELRILDRELNDHDVIRICEVMKKQGTEKVKEIRIDGHELTTKASFALINTLKECNSKVSTLSFIGYDFNIECMKQLGEYIQENNQLEILHIGDELKDKELEALVEYLIGNTSLKYLNLFDDTYLTDASASHLIELAKHSCITHIPLIYTSISSEKQNEIYKATQIPIDAREIPIKSKSKSAAKIQS